jgi:hypothetical protein
MGQQNDVVLAGSCQAILRRRATESGMSPSHKVFLPSRKASPASRRGWTVHLARLDAPGVYPKTSNAGLPERRYPARLLVRRRRESHAGPRNAETDWHVGAGTAVSTREPAALVDAFYRAFAQRNVAAMAAL